MIKFRIHKGGLKESMKTAREFTDIVDMFKYIKEYYNNIDFKNITISQSYGENELIGWKSCRYVRIENEECSYVIGFCDLGENGYYEDD